MTDAPEPEIALKDVMAEQGYSPVYDLEQATPDTAELAGIMPRPCGDCAYRKDSPERSGEDHVRGDEEFLDRIVESGEPFWCHDGMRQIVAYEHPDGVQIPAGILGTTRDVDYQPPIIGGIPYRADGRPADLCAGWSARRLKHVDRGERP